MLMVRLEVKSQGEPGAERCAGRTKNAGQEVSRQLNMGDLENHQLIHIQ